MNPLRTINATPTRWLVFVYTATYASANWTITLCDKLGVSPILPVLAASTAGNMTTGPPRRPFRVAFVEG